MGWRILLQESVESPGHPPPIPPPPPVPLLRTQTITQNRPGYRFSSWWLAHSGVCWAVDTSDVGMPVGRDGSPPPPPPPSKCNIGAEYRSSHESDCIAAPRSFTFVLCCLVLLPCLFNFSCACLVNFSSLSFTIHQQNLIQHNLSTKQHSISLRNQTVKKELQVPRWRTKKTIREQSSFIIILHLLHEAVSYLPLFLLHFLSGLVCRKEQRQQSNQACLPPRKQNKLPDLRSSITTPLTPGCWWPQAPCTWPRKDLASWSPPSLRSFRPAQSWRLETSCLPLA